MISVRDLFDQLAKTLLENIFVFVRRSADPKHQVALRVTHRDSPDPHVDEVEDKSQAKAHQDDARPNRPLAGLVRNFEAGEVGHLHVLAFEGVGGRGVLLMAWNRRQPDTLDWSLPDFFDSTTRCAAGFSRSLERA